MNKLIFIIPFLISACGPERLCLPQSAIQIEQAKLTLKENACIWMDTQGALQRMQRVDNTPKDLWATKIIVYPSTESLRRNNPDLDKVNADCAMNAQTNEAHVVARESFVFEGCLPHELAHAWKYKIGEPVNTHDAKWKQFDTALRDAARGNR